MRTPSGLSPLVLVPIAWACKDGEVEPADAGPDAVSDRFECGEPVTLTVAGATAEVPAGAAGDLAGAALRGTAGEALEPMRVTIACAEPIVSEGQRAISPAVRIEVAGDAGGAASGATAALPRDLEIALPVRLGLVPEGASWGDARVLWKPGAGETRSPLVANLAPERVCQDADPAGSAPAGAAPAGAAPPVCRVPPVGPAAGAGDTRAWFRFDALGTFQLAVPGDAGAPRTRRYAWRAIAGLSMGGVASAVIGTRHSEMFDVVAPMGADPGPDLTYMGGYLQDYFLAGFCTAEDEAAGRGRIGETCEPARRPLARQHERPQSYERLIYEDGEGTGLTLRRRLYVKGNRDIARAWGNAFYYNPDHPILPPGVPADYLDRTPAAQCAEPVVLRRFFDREYNPDGAFPVITFCDGGDSSALGFGVFDPAQPQPSPAQVLLAVDVDGDGVRDAGEPIVLHAHEPYHDVGPDGLPSAGEPGYHPAANPDPAGDDYDYRRNPGGAEGNWLWDEGEPFEDAGLDGVAGTCQHGGGKDCWDFGEGNGAFDWSPGTLRWFDTDPRHRLLAMDEDALARVDFWLDAGIRDFLNSHVSTNQLAGLLHLRTGALRLFEQFFALDGSENDFAYSFIAVDYGSLGKHVYVRYGDPEASERRIAQGDGRHVGTGIQVVSRVTTFFGFLDDRWPEGDRDDASLTTGEDSFRRDERFTSPSTGQERPYAIFLPPGYFEPGFAERRYPVLYFLHGYGMSPEDLVTLSAIPANIMVHQDLSLRMQKFIVVYVDGRCRPGFELPDQPDPGTGDRCEQGTFYLDSPGDNTAKMETLLLELVDHVDATYRTRPPSDVQVAR